MIISNAHSNPLRYSLSINNLILIHLMLINLVVDRRPVDGRFVDHCYSDIGCFPLSSEFFHPRHRPFNVRPWHRKRIKTRFDLFNHKHPEGYELQPWNKYNLLQSGFNPMLETKIIIPGWLDNIKRATWVKRMKDSFLWLWQPVNIIVVHWRNFTPYTIATANTRVVGAELANLLKSIEHELHYDRAYYHLVGHSLGAHIGGYCGDRMPGLGRITALDPARPFFQHMPKSVRLDRNDARFVDAIHSDFTPENAIFLLMSFGMTTPVGHLDFYPNGPPLLQPGCLRDTIWSVRNGIQRGLEHKSLSVAFLEAIRYLTACDHQRSHEWFIESITNRQCVFVGVRCNQFEGLINGRCTCDQSRSACAIMGIHADQMYLNKAHEDLWPLGLRKHKNIAINRPPKQPHTSYNGFGKPLNPLDIVTATTNKGQMYTRLKHQAELLRNPQVPHSIPGDGDDFLSSQEEDLSSLQDSIFVDYLRSSVNNLSPNNENFHLTAFDDKNRLANNPITAIAQSPVLENEELKRISSTQDHVISERQDEDLSLVQLLANDLNSNSQQLNDHPKLLSDIDRDIESWYEESSRWYLKTNNRPNYCVNQYQVLVFIGPLKTGNSRQSIRANLIISIIGSKGQLLNQRFVPRSANLDSFTMQPFFIILEGTYSLGNIVSVAIGWEARLDPDPIQATVSFQSNLLENFQSTLPLTYKAKHPFLSDTMKYDYSRQFKHTMYKRNIYKPNHITKRRSIRSVGPKITQNSRTSNANQEGCSVLGSTKGHCKANNNFDHPTKYGSRISGSVGGGTLKGVPKSKLLTEIDNYLDYAADEEDEDDEEEEEDDEDNDDDLKEHSNSWPQPTNISPQAVSFDLHTSGSTDEASFVPVHQHRHHQVAANHDRDQLFDDFINPKSSHEIPIIPKELIEKHQQHERDFLNTQINRGEEMMLDNKITAKFHNLGIHHQLEDSIVISQVVVSPLEANYGKGTSTNKVGKIFCPPNQNFRLHKERTIRLMPNLLGKCHQNQHHHHHHPHYHQPQLRV